MQYNNIPNMTEYRNNAWLHAILIKYFISCSATYRWIARFLQYCELPEGPYFSLNASITYEFNLINRSTDRDWHSRELLRNSHLYKSNIYMQMVIHHNNIVAPWQIPICYNGKSFWNNYPNRLYALSLYIKA